MESWSNWLGEMIFLHFLDDALRALAEVDVLNLVAEHDGEFVFVHHQRENTAAHHDLAARIGHRTAKTGMRVEMKFVGQLALGVGRDFVADFLQVGFDGLRFGGVGESLGFLKREEERVAGTDFVGDGELRRGLGEG